MPAGILPDPIEEKERTIYLNNLHIFIAIVIAVGILLWTVHRYERKRSSRLRSFARRTGLSFTKSVDEDSNDLFQEFSLFTEGQARSIRNMMRGYRDNAEVSLFEYYYADKQGQALQNFKYTVLLLRSRSLNLPYFSLQPINVFHKLDMFTGREKVSFDSHPSFEKLYVLSGDNETTLRKIFTDEVLSYFQNNIGLNIEGTSDQILLYREGTHMGPEKVHAFLNQGAAVLRLFEEAGKEMRFSGNGH
jgi:hypothetical protein